MIVCAEILGFKYPSIHEFQDGNSALVVVCLIGGVVVFCVVNFTKLGGMEPLNLGLAAISTINLAYFNCNHCIIITV